MILEVCITLAACFAPAPELPPTPEPVLLAHAAEAEERAAFREIGRAFDVVAYVTALTTPAESGRQAPTPVEAIGGRRPPPDSSAPVAGTGACGGDLPDCSIMECESGGNITAENSSSSASGKWQFLDSTWNNFQGYARASDAPEEVQDEKARQTWAGGAGRSHWSQCL